MLSLLPPLLRDALSLFDLGGRVPAARISRPEWRMIGVGLFGAMALAAVWGGYPLAVRALGGLRRKRGLAPAGPLPTVSIVLASAADASDIRERVTDLLLTRYPAPLLQVVVGLDVARASATPDDLRGMDERVVVVSGDAPGGKAATLNAAVRAARHEVLVFADTAQRFDREAIPVLVEELSDPVLGAVSGMLDLPGAHGSLNLAERYWRYERWLRSWEARLHSSVGVTGAIYAMRRSLWEPLPAGLILDDVYLPMRLALQGWRIGFTDRARAFDVRRFAARQEYHRKVRTLTGNIQVCAWLPGVLNPIRNPIWAQFLFHKLFRLLTPYLAICAVVGLGWAGVAALVASPVGEHLLIVAGIAAVVLCLIPPVRRHMTEQIAWALALQSSIVVATVNGMRGRWDVWR
jgi:cellulose synthase/poly-beta-1,6-N-acetylglucosamine synthase-like glycosyltransferase